MAIEGRLPRDPFERQGGLFGASDAHLLRMFHYHMDGHLGDRPRCYWCRRILTPSRFRQHGEHNCQPMTEEFRQLSRLGYTGLRPDEEGYLPYYEEHPGLGTSHGYRHRGGWELQIPSEFEVMGHLIQYHQDGPIPVDEPVDSPIVPAVPIVRNSRVPIYEEFINTTKQITTATSRGLLRVWWRFLQPGYCPTWRIFWPFGKINFRALGATCFFKNRFRIRSEAFVYI